MYTFEDKKITTAELFTKIDVMLNVIATELKTLGLTLPDFPAKKGRGKIDILGFFCATFSINGEVLIVAVPVSWFTKNTDNNCIIHVDDLIIRYNTNIIRHRLDLPNLTDETLAIIEDAMLWCAVVFVQNSMDIDAGKNKYVLLGSMQ